MQDPWLDKIDADRFRKEVIAWYRRHGRVLPWRNCADPYRVWVSEIMLQQTQVATVLGYFDRFVARFPTVVDLAAADEAEVLHYWQGLGYYRRARNLHQAAKKVVQEFDGCVPTEPQELRKLPGLGRYTANAIATFSSDQRLPILEANTIRLWTRLLAAPGDPTKGTLNRRLWNLSEEVLPKNGCADFNQALMDLGSEVCTARNPDCSKCPLEEFCSAKEQDRATEFPQLPKRPTIVNVDHVAIVVRHRDHVLVRQRPDAGRWASLWEFPTCERDKSETWEQAAQRAIDLAVQTKETLAIAEHLVFKHGIMHFRVTLRCFKTTLRTKLTSLRPRSRWTPLDELERLAFSSPQRRIAYSLLENGR